MMKFLRRLLVGFLCITVVVLGGFRLAAHLRESHAASDLAPAQGRFIETRDGQVFIQEVGPEDEVTLLFLHGTGAWSGLWRDTLEVMAAQGYRAIAMDLTPFGFSERASDDDYRRTRQAERIAALVEAMDITPIMVAHSFGAAPGAEAVIAAPEAYAGLVLVAGAIGLEAEAAELMPLPLRSSFARRWIGAVTALNPLATKLLLQQMIYQKDAATPERIAILQAPMTLEGSTEAFGDWLPSLLVRDPEARSVTAPAWSGLDVPVALIWGREDTLTPPAQAEQLAELTGAKPYWLDEVGHIPQIEAPVAFQTALITALRGLK